MTVWSHLTTIFNQRRAYIFTLSIALCVAFITTLLFNASVHAAPGINQAIGFQGRLQSSSGAIVPDGYYNIQFKIYQDGTGTTEGNPSGTLKWTETYVNNSNDEGVRVKNGYFSVELGSNTPFGSNIDWNQDTLWLSMNVAGSDAACTTFGTSPCTADGEMLPMKRLTAVPYALNAENANTLGGLSSDELIQNQNTAQQTASNFWISGTGRADTMLQAPALDTASSGNLDIGTTNATSINLNQDVAVAANKSLTFAAGAGNFDQSASTGTFDTGTGDVGLNGDTTIASGKTLTVNGDTLIKSATNSASAFQIQNASGSSVLNVSTNSGTTSLKLGSAGGGQGYIGQAANGTYDGSSNTSENTSLLRNVPAGHTLIGSLALEAAGSAPTLTVTDSQSNAYTVDAVSNNTSAAVNYIFSSRITTPLTTSDTITLSISGFGRIRWAWNIEQFDNIAETNRLDRTSTGTGSSQSMSSGVTAATSETDELVFGGFSYTVNAPRILTPGEGFSDSPQQDTTNGSSDRGNYVIWKTAQAAGTQEATVTSQDALTWASSVATYRTTGASGAGTIGLSDGSNNTAVISTTDLTQDRTYTFSDEDGTICLQSSASCGFLLDQTSTDQNASFRIGGTGSIASNSASAFSVQDTSGNNQLMVNNSTNRISIGTSDTTGTLLVLDTKTNTGDPTGTNGAMYYNSDAGRFRCYEDGGWKDCITPLPVSATASVDTSNSTTTPSDVTDLDFDLDANTKYHYKYIIMHESAATWAGIGFGVTTPSTPVSNHWCANTTSTLSSADPGTWGAYCGTGDASATTGGVEAAATTYTSTIEGYIETDAAGTLQLRMKSENTGEVTVQAGSFGILEIVQ